MTNSKKFAIMISSNLNERRDNEMKWMIASDIHGSAHYCRLMLDAMKREGADRLLLLGDLLYHGPRNDLPDGYAPKGVIALLNEQKEKLLCVRGNCDAEVDQMVLEFPIMADYAIVRDGELTIFATHGHLYTDRPPAAKGMILLSGHTHIPKWDVNGEDIRLNPGSVSIPKAGSVHGYMTLCDGVFRWCALDGTELHQITVNEQKGSNV